MDQQQVQQVEQQLRSNWDQVRHEILDQFPQITTADLDAAKSLPDLVQRISDRTHYTERLVETRIAEIVGLGLGQLSGSQQQQGQSQSFGSAQSSPGKSERFGSFAQSGTQS